MCRGIIWQCYDRQKAIDMLGPIMLKSKDRLGHNRMSGIFCQIKNSMTEQSMYIDAAKLGFFSPSQTDKDPLRPYIVIEMELGVQSSPPSLNVAVPRTGMETRSKHHPRYTIIIRGRSSKVYKVIGKDETATYARLLESRSLLAEHPRQDPDFVDAILRLKPMWWYGKSYDWSNAKNSTTEEHVPQGHAEEEVTVGSLANASSDDVSMG